MAQLNTRIVLRNDSAAAWNSSTDPILLKGEVGIEFDPSAVTAEGIKADYKVKMKIGDGVTPWSDLPYFGNDIEVNENAFVLGEDKVLDLYGFVDAETGAQLTKGEDGKLSWVIPSTEKVDNLQTTVDSMQEKLDSLQQKISPTDEEGNPVEGGIESEVNDLKDSVGTKEVIGEDGQVTQEATGIYKEIQVIENNHTTLSNQVTELTTLVGTDGEEPSGIFAELNEISADVEVNAGAIETEKNRAQEAERVLGEDISAINEALESIYTKTEVDGLVENVDKKFENVYTKESVYTKTEVETYVSGQIGSAGHLKRLVVSTLPEISEADPDIIYMIQKKANSQLTGDYFEEYMVINGAWEQIGNTYVDLEPYAKTEDVNKALEDKASTESVEQIAQDLLLKAAQSDLDTLTEEVAKKATKTEVEEALNLKADISVLDALSKTVADNKTEVDEQLAKKLEAEALTPYALAQDVTNGLAEKADKAETLAGYGIGDAYTKTEVDGLIGLPAEYDDNGEVSVPATGIYANTYTRQEIEDLISDITGGESAADVLAALNTYKGTNDARVKTIEDKIVDIESGAQVNVLEAIKLEGEDAALEISDKTVTIPNATAGRAGIVKLSDEIGVNSSGGLEVKAMNVNKLDQTEGEWLILNGGTSASV